MATINKKNLIINLKIYSDFPKYNLPGALLNTVASQIPILLLTAYFPLDVVGNYLLSYSIMSVPSILVGAAISNVFFQKAASMNDDRLKELIEKLFFVLTITGVVAITLAGTFGEEIFAFVFGSEWEGAGRYSLYLIPFLAFTFCTAPMGHVFIVKNKQDIAFYSNILTLLNRIVMFSIGGIIFMSADFAIILHSLSSTILGLIFTLYIFKITNANKIYLVFFVVYLIFTFTVFQSISILIFS
jgi:O-antigen/teichoic acid export membrane protein